ncbi:MAG: serine hydrolase [Acidimicrobiales bacterium]
MVRSTAIAVVAAASILVVACGSDSSGDAEPTTTTDTTVTSAGDAVAAEATASTPTTTDEAAVLVVDLLNGSPFDEAVYDAAFAPVFREALPFDDFATVVAQVAADGPWTLGPARSVAGSMATYELQAAGGDLVLLDVAIGPDGISGLFFSPDRAFDAPGSVEDAVARLTELGDLRAAVMDASQGACGAVVDRGATEIMPLGSAFKLYVLGAVVHAMDDGSIGWDTEVAVRDELDSLPSGTVQDLEPGTVMTVRELAEAMISISDNTATDHLIDLVGRAAVEDMLVPMGNDALDRNRPFLTTREMFVLKFGDPELGREFVSADESGRRAILADRVAAAPLPTAGGVDLSQPVLVDELEWFASPTALCDAMVWLTADPTALEILSMNPGVPATGSSWDTIAFKGGSEPGLITMVWWTSTEDGRAFVTAGSVVSETGPVDEFEAANLLAVLRDLGPALDEVGGSD